MSLKSMQPGGVGGVKPFLVGAIVGVPIILILFLLFAWLMSAGLLPSDQSWIYSLVSVSAGVFAGGFACARTAGQKGLIHGALLGALFFVLLLLLSLAIGNSDGFTSRTLIKAVLCLVFGVLGGVFGVNFRRSKKYI